MEAGYACTAGVDGVDTCSNGCLDGTKEAWEECDDGNDVEGDGCDNKVPYRSYLTDV